MAPTPPPIEVTSSVLQVATSSADEERRKTVCFGAQNKRLLRSASDKLRAPSSTLHQ